MSIIEALKVSFVNIRANKLRSFLTILGIVIGVTAVIGMMSLIKALEYNVSSTMESLGGNSFYIQRTPAIRIGRLEEKYRRRKKITLREARALQQLGSYFSFVSPEGYAFGHPARYKDRKTNADVIILGADQYWFNANLRFLQEGRAFAEIDVFHRKNVCILGMDVVEKLFPYEDPVGKYIHLRNGRFQVIGVLEPKGKIFGSSQDNFILLPITTFLQYFGKERSLGINIRVRPAVAINDAIDQAISIMRVVRKLKPADENDFEIITRDQVMKTLKNLTGFVFIAAIVICSISLLVGGIGIMNIMLVSVKERTREIGIRKAVGARRIDILNQFLLEAVVLCMVGGVIGVFLGVVLALLISSGLGLPLYVPVWAVFLGLGFSVFVGVVFGVYPASRAAAQRPIEALRYE